MDESNVKFCLCRKNHLFFFFARTTEQRNGKTETPWHCSRMFKPGSQVFALKRIGVSASNFFTGLTHLVLTFLGRHSTRTRTYYCLGVEIPRRGVLTAYLLAGFPVWFLCPPILWMPVRRLPREKEVNNEVTSSICWKCPRQTLVNNAGSDRDQTNVYFHICWKPIHAIC